MSALKGGMKVKMGELEAFVHEDHFSGEYDENDQVSVRVLFVTPTLNTIHVTCKNHISFVCPNIDPFQTIKLGETITDASVISSARHGLVLKLKNQVLGSVSQRQIADQKVPNVKEAYPVGKTVTCRIMQYDHVAAMYICSMKKSVLAQMVVQFDQLEIGQKVSCTLKKHTPKGAVVELAKNISAFIPLLHMSDVPLKNPEKKYPEGSKLKCRVLALEKEGKSILLTNKSILVNEEYPIVSDYNEANEGVVTEGVVEAILDSGLRLRMFGKAKGFVPRSKISTEKVEFLEKLFFVGQVILSLNGTLCQKNLVSSQQNFQALKCQIVSVDPIQNKMVLSLVIGGHHKPLGSKEKRRGDVIKLGQIYS